MPGPGKRGEARRGIYEFVRERVALGLSPSVREVQQAFGFKAVQSAQSHLDALVAEGLLLRDQGKARSYRVAGQGLPPTRVPILGRVQAGLLTEALEEVEGYLAVELRAGLVASALFGLRVRGDSMVDAGILPDDLLLVKRQPVAELGEIVVALVGDEATVKRLGRVDGRVALLPANPAYAPIVPEQLRLLGKVIEVRRYLDGQAPGPA